MTDSMQDTIGAAFDKAEAAEVETGNSSVIGNDGSNDDSVADIIGAKPTEKITPEDTGDSTGAPDSVTDPDKAEVKKDADTGTPADVDGVLVEGAKAPSSWSPEAREAWGKLPQAVKDIVEKREAETARVLNDTAEARKTDEAFKRLTAPYAPLFQAQGVDPMTAINNILQTASGLQGGTVMQKAQIVQQLITDYGIDIKTLDDLLVGQTPAAADTPEIAELRTRLDSQDQFINTQKQQQQQAANDAQVKMDRETNDFMSSHEFSNDLRQTMIGFFNAHPKDLAPMSLQTAYDMALQTRPDILKVIADRGTSATSATALAAAQQAASSLPQSGSPGGESLKPPANMREAIEQAIDQG